MVLPHQNSVETSIFTASEGGWGRASGIGCAVEVRDRPELFRVVVRIDRGFETTGVEPWTHLPSPGRGRFLPFLAVWRKISGTSGGAYAAPTEASLLAPPLTDTPNV